MDKAGKKAEGAFYMWSADEVDEVLGTDSERSRVFKQHYYVKPGGNTDLSPRRHAPPASPVYLQNMHAEEMNNQLALFPPHGKVQLTGHVLVNMHA